jgi:hypothetical protein
MSPSQGGMPKKRKGVRKKTRIQEIERGKVKNRERKGRMWTP